MRILHAILCLLLVSVTALTVNAATIAITSIDAVDTPDYDLTNVYGTADWAYWAQTSNPLTAPVTPSNEKAAASLIGSMSAVSGTGVRGSTSTSKPLYDFTFADGAVTTSGTASDLIGLFNSSLGSGGVGAGVQMNVIAPSADPFNIFVWGTAFQATGTLTATAGAASQSDSSLTTAGTRSPG